MGDKMTPGQWIMYGEVGISSKTIWSVMTGVISGHGKRCDFYHDVPHDPDDFRRCHLLLAEFPEWRVRLHDVASVFPAWRPMVENWDKMTALFIEEKDSGKAPKLYELMRKLVDEGKRIDGWVETCLGSWRREN